MNQHFGALVVIAGIALAACSSTAPEVPSPASSTEAASAESTTSTPPETTPSTTEPPEADRVVLDRGSARWALIDGVALHRKPGLAIRRGLSYNPLLGADKRQIAAQLHIETEQSALAFAPAYPSGGRVDQIQLGEFNDSATPTLFAIDDSTGLLHLFASAARCDDPTTTFSSSGLDIPLEGRVDFTDVRCAETTVVDNITIGVIDPPIESVRSFGVLLDGTPGATVELDWLALGDSDNLVSAGTTTFEITIEDIDQAVAVRSTDPGDDIQVDSLTVTDIASGERSMITAKSRGVFDVPIERGAIVDISLDDYGLDRHLIGGPWLDSTHAATAQRMNLAPLFEPTSSPPEGGARSREPHVVSIFVGGPQMERQEYRGLTFTNNVGDADRDRLTSNVNSCRRVGYLGGSYVEAIQTRVDQKPGIIAERLLDIESETCVEVITIGRDTFTVENHAANVDLLINDYGVDTLVFALSELELCRMYDPVYELSTGVSANTPLRWRFIDGEFFEPVTRRNADVVDVPDDGPTIGDICGFDGSRPELVSAVESLMTKLAALTDAYEAKAPGLKIHFLNTRGGLSNAATVDQLIEQCNAFALDCSAVRPPLPLEKPDGLESDVSPHLFRYAFDAHPNERANQVIGRALADIILAG